MYSYVHYKTCFTLPADLNTFPATYTVTTNKAVLKASECQLPETINTSSKKDIFFHFHNEKRTKNRDQERERERESSVCY